MEPNPPKECVANAPSTYIILSYIEARKIYRLATKNYKSSTKAFGLSGMIIILGVRGLKFDSQNAPNNIISK